MSAAKRPSSSASGDQKSLRQPSTATTRAGAASKSATPTPLTPVPPLTPAAAGELSQRNFQPQPDDRLYMCIEFNFYLLLYTYIQCYKYIFIYIHV